MYIREKSRKFYEFVCPIIAVPENAIRIRPAAFSIYFIYILSS